MAERIPIAFLAGVISVLTPCVLPLVPGYLTAVSSVEASRLGEKGVARRIAIASVPFMIGFTVVFVALGTVAIAGFILVVLGLVFMGLLPWPERIMGAGLLGKARQRESNALLGAAFAVCAAPCIGPVLASVLVLASSSSTVLRGSVLLFAYSLGIGVAFLLAGIAFARAMGAFRWVRDHYTLIRMISGATLIALGLLLFFGKDWWLHVWLNRALDAVGLGSV
jgi:cytochrome c-type biogenesis protein